MEINVSELINSPAALTVEQGNLLFDEVITQLNEADKVKIDFSGIESIITPFLNSSIGRLYEKYTSDELSSRIEFENLPEGTRRKFNMVIRNAKQFYADKRSYSKIVGEVLDD